MNTDASAVEVGSPAETSKESATGFFTNKLDGPLNPPGSSWQGGRSPFSATSVILAGGLFLGALGFWIMGSGKAPSASWLHSAAPGTMAVTGSYLGGFFIGWGARRTLKVTTMVIGAAIAATGVLVWLGWDATALQSWLNSACAWAGENIEGYRRYLVSLLPSATAAGAGGVLGFKRK